MPGGIPRDRQASAGGILPVNLGVNATLLLGNQTIYLGQLITPKVESPQAKERLVQQFGCSLAASKWLSNKRSLANSPRCQPRSEVLVSRYVAG